MGRPGLPRADPWLKSRCTLHPRPVLIVESKENDAVETLTLVMARESLRIVEKLLNLLVEARNAEGKVEEVLPTRVRRMETWDAPMRAEDAHGTDVDAADESPEALPGAGRRILRALWVMPRAVHEAQVKKKPNPLDAMLEDEDWDPMKPDAKLEALRKRLEEQKRKRADGKEGASAVLARRAQAGAEASKKRKKESEKDKVTKALKTLAATKAKEESSSTGEDSDDDETIFGGGRKDGDLMSRQRRLRKVSAERPGALLTRGFALMHEQLGTLHGDSTSAGSKEDVLQPGALRYLLSSALPMTDVKKIGEERMRELRTLATTLDLVVGGKMSTVGDYLMQRFKSILMSLRDGSTAAFQVPGAGASGALSDCYVTGGDRLCQVFGCQGCKVAGAPRPSGWLGLGTRRGEVTPDFPSAPPQVTCKRQGGGGELTTEEACLEGSRAEEEPQPLEEGCEVCRASCQGHPSLLGGSDPWVDADGRGSGCCAKEPERVEDGVEEEDLRLQTIRGGQAWERRRRQGHQAEEEVSGLGAPFDGVHKPDDALVKARGVVSGAESGPVLAGCSSSLGSPVAAGPGSGTASADQAGAEGSEKEAAAPAMTGDVVSTTPPFWFDDNVRGYEVSCEFFKSFQLRAIRQLSFRELCNKVALLQASVFQLGVSMMQLLLCSPRDGMQVCHWMHEQFSQLSPPPSRARDIFPLPLPPVGAALRLVAMATQDHGGVLAMTSSADARTKRVGRQQRKKLVFEGTKQIWRCLCVVVLNGMSQGWQLLPCTRGRLSGNQKAAMGVINMWIDLFCQQPQQVVQLPCFPDLVKNRQLDYTGEELVTALPLRLEELRPGLPDKGIAGSLSAVTAAAGFVQAWVADPWLTLKPEGMWPSKTPRARINATRDEWNRVCAELYDRGIIEAIPLSQVFHANGLPVLNGAFAVEKRGKAGAGQCRVTRLIMNLVPTNAFQRLMRGDLDTLASSVSWSQLILREDEVSVEWGRPKRSLLRLGVAPFVEAIYGLCLACARIPGWICQRHGICGLACHTHGLDSSGIVVSTSA